MMGNPWASARNTQLNGCVDEGVGRNLNERPVLGEGGVERSEGVVVLAERI